MHSYVFPGNIDPEIAEIGSKEIPYMRTSRFSDINIESERILLELIHCREGKAITYTGSGTGAMSAVVENYVRTKAKAIAINGGAFGARWVSMCRYYDVPVIDFKVPFAHDMDYAAFENVIAEERPDVLLCQHHETSSGVLYNLRKISEICHRYGVSMVVDVISSFLAEELDMDGLGIDICLTSTQKGLNIPPGLSIVFLSDRIKEYDFAHAGYYWDFKENLDNLRRGQTPFSPATLIYLQLNERLRRLQAEGGEARNIAAVHHRAGIFRDECLKYGWDMPAESPSCAITAIQTRDTEARVIFNGLIERYDTYIMPGGKPGYYRISHMGLGTDEDIIELARRIYELEKEVSE